MGKRGQVFGMDKGIANREGTGGGFVFFLKNGLPHSNLPLHEGFLDFRDRLAI